MQALTGSVGRDRTGYANVSRNGSVRQPDTTVDLTTILGQADFTQLQNIDDRQSRVAAMIRSDDQQLKKFGQILGDMNKTLTTIVKNYPPYPPGEPARVKFLRSFNGLRQQIDKMTIPPEDKWLGLKLGGINGGSVSSVTGASFNIPELSDVAGEAEIQSAQVQIDRAQAASSEQRAALADQAAAINQAEGYGAKANLIVGSSQEDLIIGVPGEAETEQKSQDVRTELQKAPGNGLSASEPQLMMLAG